MSAQIEGWAAGNWVIDPSHSTISFQVRHLAISKVRGFFERFSGEIETGQTPERSSVRAQIEVASVSTGNADRDAHLLAPDFFDAEAHPSASFASTSVRIEGESAFVDGELTLKGITQRVTIEAAFGGIADDAYGNRRFGLEGSLTLDRRDFGISFNVPDAAGGLVLGHEVSISLDIQAVLQP